MSEAIDLLTNFLLKANRTVVFTGAGISTESGISDYRSKGGIWDKFRPVTYQEFLSSQEKRKEYWRTKRELYASLVSARPNDGHRAVRELERHGKLKGIITQNIDGLHQLAGSTQDRILELHGNNRETLCLSCGDVTPWEDVYRRLERGEDVPLCLKCRGLLKPNTISFGQNLNPEILDLAVQWSKACDLFIAVGSTLVVEPAATLPMLAKQKGAQLVIITLSATPLDDLADLKINAKAGETLKAAVELAFIRRQGS